MSNFRRPLQDAFLLLEAIFDKPFGPEWNPFRQMGTLAFFFFWVAAVSGIYIYILFDTSVAEAYQSIEYMTYEQWYLGGIMRSLHRYASDAMVVTAALHMSREFIFDRYRDVRWFTWFTGVPILWFLYTSGISGYWLVWDQLAQYVAIGSMEWLDWLGIYGEPVANNFLTRGSLTDRFFTLLIFMHIFAPLILLFIMWIHVMRVAQPKINPPRGLALGSLLMLVVLALVKPAVSHAPADLGTTPTDLNLDWYYMLFYPVFDKLGPGALWGLAIGISFLIASLPWLPPLRRPKAAMVTLDQCNGCTRCFNDCPFGAVTMQPRTDGRPYEQEAIVNPKLCTSCGICVGACPTSTPFRHSDMLVTGIDLPDFPLAKVRAKFNKAIESARQAEGPSILIVGCDHGVDTRSHESAGVASAKLPCIGMLPPSFIDYALGRDGADGMIVTGCRDCDCFSRLGIRWTEDRLAGARDPYLRKRVPRERLKVQWAGRTDGVTLDQAIEAFRGELTALDEAEAAAKETGGTSLAGETTPAAGGAE